MWSALLASCSRLAWPTVSALAAQAAFLYIDGDADFYQPEVNPLRGAASASDLAFATGRGPDIVCDLEGRRPLVRDGDVAVLGCRDAADRERRGCQPLPADMLVLDREHVRQVGAEGAARQACARPSPRIRLPDCRSRSTTLASTRTDPTAASWRPPYAARLPGRPGVLRGHGGPDLRRA